MKDFDEFFERQKFAMTIVEFAFGVSKRCRGDGFDVGAFGKVLGKWCLLHCVGPTRHARSLYVEGIVPGPTGDKGANAIPTKQRRNLHALWDGLLGTSGKPIDVASWAFDVRQDKAAMNEAEAIRMNLEPSQWLAESIEASKQFIYTPDVLASVEAAARSGASKVETVDLSKAYLKYAGIVAQRKVAVAGFRLGKLLSDDLK